MRNDHVTLSVLHLSGALASVEVTAEEYDRLFKEVAASPEGHMMLVGTSAEGLPFKIAIGEDLAVWAEGGGVPADSEDTTVNMTLAYRSGAKAEILMQLEAYRSIVSSFNRTGIHRGGVGPNGRMYRLKLGLAIAITATPVVDRARTLSR